MRFMRGVGSEERAKAGVGREAAERLCVEVKVETFHSSAATLGLVTPCFAFFSTPHTISKVDVGCAALQ